MIQPAPEWIQTLLVMLVWLAIGGICVHGIRCLVVDATIKKYRRRHCMSVQCLYCKVVIELTGKTVHQPGCPMYEPRKPSPERSVIKYEIPAGDPGRPCDGCGKNIYFVKTKSGAWMPVEFDGTPHWGKCPNREEFGKAYRRKKSMEDL